MRAFLLAILCVVVGALLGGFGPLSSAAPKAGSVAEAGRSRPVTQDLPSALVVPASAGSPGHIDGSSFWRFPTGWPPRPISDGLVFTADDAAGLIVSFSGATVGDRWIWRYFAPGFPPPAPPYSECAVEILAANDPNNPSGQIALTAFCGVPSPQVLKTYPSGCPCSSSGTGVLLVVAGFAAALPGPWSVVVDFRDDGGAGTSSVASAGFSIVDTPAFLVTHGYGDDCGGVVSLRQLLREALALDDSNLSESEDRVQCYKYDPRAGVTEGAIGMAGRVRKLRSDLSMPPAARVHLVGHSMGGLVARRYFETLYGSPDGPIGSIHMLGTPNEGVFIANVEKHLCKAVLIFGLFASSACKLADWTDVVDDVVNFETDSDGTADMTPGSDLLDLLNDGFELPPTPPYRTYIGGKGSKWGGPRPTAVIMTVL